ncbi:hypothetical protein [Sulfurimonas sp.]|jgi:hypothetical protein|uniref:hypothetical protein n=1 Tax=Sulfurimonas sp. TaxID=2022749 RepID=UPI0025F149DC|nr:hypothetical protein [Sulfurimonas sp.]MBT5934861.1 hypothetical protein [Sulfurimonas sp.]
MDTKVTTIKMRFILRNENEIVMPMDSNSEIKTFLFKVETSFFEEVKKYDDTFSSEQLFEEIVHSLHFNEFLIQLFYENYDVFLASMTFELDTEEYFVSDVGEEYSYWIDKGSPRIIIGEDYGLIEMDIYQFDNYAHDFGMNKENLEFKISTKEIT